MTCCLLLFQGYLWHQQAIHTVQDATPIDGKIRYQSDGISWLVSVWIEILPGLIQSAATLHYRGFLTFRRFFSSGPTLKGNLDAALAYNPKKWHACCSSSQRDSDPTPPPSPKKKKAWPVLDETAGGYNPESEETPFSYAMFGRHSCSHTHSERLGMVTLYTGQTNWAPLQWQRTT